MNIWIACQKKGVKHPEFWKTIQALQKLRKYKIVAKSCVGSGAYSKLFPLHISTVKVEISRHAGDQYLSSKNKLEGLRE